MGEAFDLFAETIVVQRLDGLDHPRMERAPPLLQEPVITHLMRESVLEGVLEIWIELGLVKELSSLQAAKSTMEGCFWQVGDGLEQRERNVLADDGGALQEAFVVRR